MRVPGRSDPNGWASKVAFLVPFFYLAWGLALAAHLGLANLANWIPFSLKGFYAFSAGVGWLAGNIYVMENRRMGRRRKRHLVFWLFGPPGLVHLLARTLPVALQEAVPLLPLLGFGIFGVFFAVPVTFSRTLKES